MLVFIVLCILPQVSFSQSCKAVTMEGGGSHGAYEAGVLWALANLSSPSDINWNVVTGISTGALNSFGVLQFAQGDEIAMSKFLVNLWLTLNGTASVYKPWGGGEIDGLLFHSGMYDTSPLIETLRNNYKYGVKRNVTVGSTNLDTGLFGTFNESVGNAILDAIACSAAPPFFFPPHDFEGYTWADGGCIINLDVFSAVERCLDVTSEENIIVDMIFCTEISALPNETTFKTPEVLARIFQIRSYDSSVWYKYNAMQAYPKVNYRYAIVPTAPFPGGIVPLNFTQSVLEFEVQLGINDTKAILESGKSGKDVIKELYEKNKNSIIYP